ncbi:hypothetical protein DERF_005346 [Dermatophagoides farinae]|uniref:Transmembrane protein n=1 Tax=Dermatophagoides farinae TaxID=6954 RepID=A0A922I811_DERFA|nr:hypothetical protein DERF_005346 [Dermatophagoides farinae]
MTNQPNYEINMHQQKKSEPTQMIIHHHGLLIFFFIFSFDRPFSCFMKMKIEEEEEEYFIRFFFDTYLLIKYFDIQLI